MTPTLLSLPRLDEVGHGLEYLVGPPQVLQHKVLVVQLQKTMIKFVLLRCPVSLLNILGLRLSGLRLQIHTSFLGLLPVLPFSQSDVALLPEKGLEIVP